MKIQTVEGVITGIDTDERTIEITLDDDRTLGFSLDDELELDDDEIEALVRARGRVSLAVRDNHLAFRMHRL